MHVSSANPDVTKCYYCVVDGICVVLHSVSSNFHEFYFPPANTFDAVLEDFLEDGTELDGAGQENVAVLVCFTVRDCEISETHTGETTSPVSIRSLPTFIS